MSCARRSIGALLLALGLALLSAWPASAQETTPNVVHQIIPRGNRRIPAETIRARVFTHPGDPYDPAALERDFNSLWNTGYFEDLRFERAPTPQGWDIIIYVKEKPTIREIDYQGLNSVSKSDVLDRFKERKVSVSQESQYDPTKVKRAEVVLKELLAEHGRQFATVKTEVHPIPPAAVGLTFVVNEGPKVKVGKITFEGNNNVKSRDLQRAMKNLKPIGIPHSIFLENLFARTYDATKLNEDTERVRDAYQQRGYFKALVNDPQTKIRETSGGVLRVPFTKSGPGKAVDINIPVQEGEKYYLAAINFSGNKAITNTALLRKIFPMKDGDVFDTSQVRKGLEALRKAYGELGYINFTPVPDTKIDDEHHKITLNIDLDEGKQFFVRRIEFQGNTTTRDKVIRRELAVEEGQVFNSRLWELSLLRLNQLQYFEPLKTEGQAAPGERSDEIKTNNQDGTVDITLKVKEKGKNSIGLTGGVSGLAGTFIGINYTTNNFLGLGETLQVTFNIGNLQRDLTFGFTEPYAFDRPLQLGFTIYDRLYKYNQAQQASILAGTPVNLSQAELQSLQNFSQSSTGLTLSAGYPIKRSFKRIGITYTLDRSSLETFTTASTDYFQFLNFRSIAGPSALTGIITSKVTPVFSLNTIDNPMRPHRGQEFFASMDIAGLGGNVKDIRPTMQYKRFIPMKGLKPQKSAAEGRNTLGFRLMGSFISGYGGIAAPPFERFYAGGDNDLRGFDIRSITPYAFITTTVNYPLTTPGGQPLYIYPQNHLPGGATVALPVQQVVFTGGDTDLVSNLEYRIPIAGPVSLAPFADFGYNFAARESQLQLNAQELEQLNTTLFGCPTFVTGVGCLGASPVSPPVSAQLHTIPGTNFVPRMSTGLELQVIMPVINAPFRIYYAYNPLRLDTTVQTHNQFTCASFPSGVGSQAIGAGAYSCAQAEQTYTNTFLLREPAKTFRFTVSTTF
jgi:outer membrane protein insertion porin family